MQPDPPAPSDQRKKEILVFIIRRESQCGECGREQGPGSFLRLDGEKALCLECADLDRLEFLARGTWR